MTIKDSMAQQHLTTNPSNDYQHSFEKDLISVPKIIKVSDLSPDRLKIYLSEEIPCPHCDKSFQRKNMVIASKTQKKTTDYHVQYLPGGRRIREEYYLYTRHYFRCPNCDNTIKRIEKIKSNADVLGRRIGLFALILTFIVGTAASYIWGSVQGVGEIIVVPIIWGCISIVLFLFASISLPSAFSKEAVRIEKESSIDLAPSISPLHNADYIEIDEEADSLFADGDLVVEDNLEQSWPLMEFARMKGKMQVGTFTNNSTGEKYKSAVFTDREGNQCMVSFSKKLGELTPAEIVARKNELIVVQRESGMYELCRP